MLSYKSSPRAGKHTLDFPNKLDTNIQEIVFFCLFHFLVWVVADLLGGRFGMLHIKAAIK